MTKNKDRYYVNKEEFTEAVLDYSDRHKKAIEAGEEPPVVDDYIAECFMKITEGMGQRKNFRRYSYLDEMKSDALEDCLKGVANFTREKAEKPGKTVNNIEKSGKANAFGYFSQVCFWAFVRRIKKEQKESEGRKKYIIASGVENFVEGEAHEVKNYLDELKSRIDQDAKDKEDHRVLDPLPDKPKKKRLVDSNLNDFFIEE